MQKCQIRVSHRQRQQEEKKKDNRWTNRWTKGGHKEVTHACKKWKVEEFFDIQGKLLFTKKSKKVKEKKKRVQEEGDQENKRSNKKGKEVNTKRD